MRQVVEAQRVRDGRVRGSIQVLEPAPTNSRRRRSSHWRRYCCMGGWFRVRFVEARGGNSALVVEGGGWSSWLDCIALVVRRLVVEGYRGTPGARVVAFAVDGERADVDVDFGSTREVAAGAAVGTVDDAAAAEVRELPPWRYRYERNSRWVHARTRPVLDHLSVEYGQA